MGARNIVTDSDVAVLVLGMHRSGTSCLAGCLEELGLRLGDVFLWNPHNLKGNREHRAVQQLNEDLLCHNGGRWDEPVEVRRWTADHERARTHIVTELAAGERPWGFKDPRTLFTLDFWRAALPDARLVGTFRHPLAVARSLQRRDPAFTLERGLTLWRRYNEQLLCLTQAHPLMLIPFDLPTEEYRERVLHVARLLNLPGASAPAFFDPLLRQQHVVDDIPESCRDVHQQLSACADGVAAS